MITANSGCSGTQGEAAVERCSAHSAFVNMGLGSTGGGVGVGRLQAGLIFRNRDL